MSGANPLREIEALLGRGIGLDAQSVGSSLISIAIANRRKKRSIKSDAEYAAIAASSPAEFQALVEEIVVPETWFFRDHESFEFLARWAREWLPTQPYHALRILSAPCSSGEEPYTIVMTLLEAGISPDRFSVEAFDISAAALEKARRAVYGRNSFRGQPLEFRDKYFRKTADGWRLDGDVARQVQFRQANIVEPNSVRKEGELDILFCRNLLIYFDDAARARVMAYIGKVLSPAGVLFLGHAEGGLAHQFGFEPIPSPMTFAFRKAPAQQGARAAAPRLKAPRPPRHPLPPVIQPAPVRKAEPPRPAAVRRAKPAPAATKPREEILADARRLADQGRFGPARTACEAVLEAGGSSSGVYYLLALIEEGAGDDERAVEYYRKTLYIEPDHEEALVQLSLLEKKQGRAKASRQLEERVRRVRARKESRKLS